MPTDVSTTDGAAECVFRRLSCPLRERDDLLRLFVEDLGFERIEQPIPVREETFGRGEAFDLAAQCRPLRLAGHGDFQILYAELNGERLDTVRQRLLAAPLLRIWPDALFVFARAETLGRSEGAEIQLVHAKLEGDRRVFRRFRIGPGEPYRTTAERLALLDIRRAPAITTLELRQQLDEAFNVEAVTRQFYQEIANWYFWARQHAVFPMPPNEANPEAHLSQSLIRLITRLLFCWFVRQMGLIPRELFDLRSLASLLKGGDRLPESEDTRYYKAILQNLFFATLNQEIGKRQFRKRNRDPHGRDPHRGITNLYRYEDLFTDPRAFLRLMEGIPFLNGGLFECLDQVFRVEENRPDIRLDGFSDHPQNPLSMPDFLFFSEERTTDLSAIYGEARYRRARVRGLIRILERYNFTVTEATPLDQDVALDPELAGKVFENLLAAYNPETATTARKATGSYYTPREVVDYMVDESLQIYLERALKEELPRNDQAAADRSPSISDRIRHLLAYTDEPHRFTPEEVRTLIGAIDRLKALDPACGSGAFPMGLLHKLVFILRKLDPRNEQWKERQINRVKDAMRAAEQIEDAAFRERTLRDLEQQIVAIEEAFARNELDYGRKLYLIENCIYGVDIQPIAVQIAKMRFFISLTVEQRPDPTAPNLGIRPLPNLETKFVAANTLFGIERPAQGLLRNPRIEAKEAELRQVRERHFTARTPATKAKYREQDARLRAEISELLRADGFPRETTEKLAHWNPYDQNASADFFDPEWMFGLREGFDIVLGNPPYVRQEEIRALKPALQAEGYECYCGTADLYVYFYERGIRLLRPGGVLAFISSNKYFRSAYGEKLRGLLARQTIHRLIDFGDAPVFTAIAYPSIIVLSRRPAEAQEVRVLNWKPGPAVERFPEVFEEQSFSLAQKELRPDGWRIEGRAALRLLEKMRASGMPLGEYVKRRFYRGILTGLNEAFVVDRAMRDRLIAEHPSSAEVLKPFLRGRDVKRWRCEFKDLWLIFTRRGIDIRKYPAIYEYLKPFKKRLMPGAPGGRKPGHYEWYEIQDAVDYWQEFEQPKIVFPDIAPSAQFAWDADCRYLVNTSYIMVASSWLLAILNSALIHWFYCNVSNAIRGGYLRYISQYVCQIPIPAIAPKEQSRMELLVSQILNAKEKHPTADVSALEREIDEVVYRLYGLTPEEIRLVEEGVGRAG